MDMIWIIMFAVMIVTCILDICHCMYQERRVREIEKKMTLLKTDIYNKMSNILDNDQNVLDHANRTIALANDMLFCVNKIKNTLESDTEEKNDRES